MQGRRCGWAKAGLLISFLLLTATPSHSQETWQRLLTADGRFSIELPSTPEHLAERKLLANANVNYMSHRYVSKAGDLTFIIFSSVYPDSVDFSNTRKYLENGVSAVAKKSKIQSVSWRKIQGFDALDFTSIRNQKTESRSVAVFAGYASIQATVAGPLGSTTSAEAKRFINSIQIDMPSGDSVQ